MNVDSIRLYCLSFPEATEKLQWGDNLCFKVAGKTFVLVSLDATPPTVCFKCAPERFAELLEQEGIRPAPYLGRYKWVLLDRLDVLRGDELQELIRESYEMVVAKIGSPKQKSRRATRGRVAVKKIKAARSSPKVRSRKKGSAAG